MLTPSLAAWSTSRGWPHFKAVAVHAVSPHVVSMAPCSDRRGLHIVDLRLLVHLIGVERTVL
jgi:hypothetical protein